MRVLATFFFIAAAAMTFTAVPARAEQCSPIAQVEKCESQCRFCTEGNHGSACFAGYWNSSLKPERKTAKWMLTDGSYSRGYNTNLVSELLEQVVKKKGGEIDAADLKNDDVVKYGNEVMGSALGTVAGVLDDMGLKDNEMKLECYRFCDNNPVNHQRPNDWANSRASLHLKDGSCNQSGSNTWHQEYLTTSLEHQGELNIASDCVILFKGQNGEGESLQLCGNQENWANYINFGSGSTPHSHHYEVMSMFCGTDLKAVEFIDGNRQEIHERVECGDGNYVNLPSSIANKGTGAGLLKS